MTLVSIVTSAGIPQMTIRDAILRGEELLRQNGIDSPRWNAERLLLLALKKQRSHIYSELNRNLTSSEMGLYEGLLHRRAECYPLAYLEGTQEFYGRQFYVDERVLIPRAETEEIIQAVLELPLPAGAHILDLGAGSGNISVTLSLEIPDSVVFALELSAGALEVLRRNSGDKIHIVRGDFRLVPFVSECFDVVVANPPYVEASSFLDLPRETQWEPRIALAVESLEELYRTLMDQAKRLLKQPGHLLFEIGYGQEERILKLYNSKEWHLKQVRKDRSDVPRIFVLQRLADE